MPRRSATTTKKLKAGSPGSGNKKKDLHLTVTPLSMKKSLHKKVESPPKSDSSSRSASLTRLSGSPKVKSVLDFGKRVVLSPKSSAKMSRNQGGADDSLNFHRVSPIPSPVAVTPPKASPARRGMAPPHGEVPLATKKASVSSKKKVVSLPGVVPSLSHDSLLSTSTTRHDSMKSMRENAISIIASITDDEARVEHSVPTLDSHDEDETEPMPTSLSGRRQSDASSVASGYDLEQTPSSAFVVTLDRQADEVSEEDDGTTQSSKATKKKRRKGPALCFPSSKRQGKQKKQARESVSVEMSQLTESEDATGTESEDVEEEEALDTAEVTILSSRPVMLDGYTPIDKGMPLNRSQIVKTVGGHKYKFSPVKGGRKGVTPGRRRTKRTKVPVLSDGERYAYTVDENVLHTVAGRVRPLEERNEKEQRRERKPSKEWGSGGCIT